MSVQPQQMSMQNKQAINIQGQQMDQQPVNMQRQQMNMQGQQSLSWQSLNLQEQQQMNMQSQSAQEAQAQIQKEKLLHFLEGANPEQLCQKINASPDQQRQLLSIVQQMMRAQKLQQHATAVNGTTATDRTAATHGTAATDGPCRWPITLP